MILILNQQGFQTLHVCSENLIFCWNDLGTKKEQLFCKFWGIICMRRTSKHQVVTRLKCTMVLPK